MNDYKAKRDAALLGMAEEAIQRYNEECMGGGEPDYPLWATHLIEVLSEVEVLRGQVIPHTMH